MTLLEILALMMWLTVGLGVALEEADNFAQLIAAIIFWPTVISFALLKHLKK